MTAKIYHAMRWTGTRFTATACGAKSWDDDGLTSDNPARVTCAKCLALLGPVAVAEPLPMTVAPPVVAAKKARIKHESIQGSLL